MKEITEDTFVGYDSQGNEIRAECLQKWAYNQLAASSEMYEALKELMAISVGCWRHGHPVFDKVRQAIAKVEGE